MTSEQKNVLTWAAILGATGIVIYKFKDSLFGGGFNPTDLSVISSVWNDGTTPSKKYTYTFHASVASNGGKRASVLRGCVSFPWFHCTFSLESLVGCSGQQFGCAQ